MTSGCYGFAAKYMHWPEDLLVGGAVRNKTGHIKQAKALQTVVQLMDVHEMYEFWFNTWKVHHIGWSQEKAALVLDMWQKRFSQEIRTLTSKNITSPSYHFNTFSTATLNDILEQHSQLNLVKLSIALAMVVSELRANILYLYSICVYIYYICLYVVDLFVDHGFEFGCSEYVITGWFNSCWTWFVQCTWISNECTQCSRVAIRECRSSVARCLPVIQHLPSLPADQ